MENTPKPYRSIHDVVEGGHLSWSEEVKQVVDAIQRRGRLYAMLGYLIYGLGSVLIFLLMWDKPGLATAAVMFFFQLCVIFFATTVIYPCIGGGFWLSIAANRDSVPAFKDLAKQSGEVSKAVKQAGLDIQQTGDRIQNEVASLRTSMTKPIVPPARKIVAPLEVIPSGGSPEASGNGSKDNE